MPPHHRHLGPCANSKPLANKRMPLENMAGYHDTSLTVLTLNCQSILAKRGSFINLIDAHNPDIIIGSESWLKSDILSCEVFPPGYTVYRHDRADGYGGVFVAYSESLVSSSLETGDSSCELVAGQICLANNPTLIICSMYRSPSSNDQYLVSLCNQLETIIKSHPNSVIWLSGDLNLPDINWCDNCVDGHNYRLNTNHIFLDFLNNNGLTQIVDFPTRGTNTSDIFITNRPSLIDMCIPIDGISDHEAIQIIMRLLRNSGLLLRAKNKTRLALAH